ncbi:hypothetical protein [Brevibacterium litoralis]|uniref:hypothetical protein n=1 Tax=Brevibacterium litoralis TaxID=3138935 RepID=UPI0032EC023B
MVLRIVRTVFLTLALVGISVAACVRLVDVFPAESSFDHDLLPYGVLENPAHPVSFLVYTTVVLTGFATVAVWKFRARTVGTKVVGSLPVYLAASTLVLAAGWMGLQDGTIMWDGADPRTGQPIGGMIARRPTSWVSLLWVAVVCQVAAAVLALAPVTRLTPRRPGRAGGA